MVWKGLRVPRNDPRHSQVQHILEQTSPVKLIGALVPGPACEQPVTTNHSCRGTVTLSLEGPPPHHLQTEHSGVWITSSSEWLLTHGFGKLLFFTIFNIFFWINIIFLKYYFSMIWLSSFLLSQSLIALKPSKENKTRFEWSEHHPFTNHESVTAGKGPHLQPPPSWMPLGSPENQITWERFYWSLNKCEAVYKVNHINYFILSSNLKQ